MLLINNIKLPLYTDFDNLLPIAVRELKIAEGDIALVRLYKKSVDARKRNDISFCCSLLVELKGEENRVLKHCKNAQQYYEKPYIWKKATVRPKNRPVVVGFGPAGMFAALTLARAGLSPIVFERGSRVEQRTERVNSFFNGGKLDGECNVQFGEGGAGTFSDGKLTTGIKNSRCKTVLKELYLHGAKESILYEAKPHIGTDVLVNVVKSIREEILSLGGEIHFDTRLDSITVSDRKIISVCAGGLKYPCDKLILATGHSARDTFSMLLENGVVMERKPFSMGVRIEHLQKNINRALYGDFADSPYLKAADYKLATHLENGRGVYTFCMCPGGEVINASSEQGKIAVNGMSNSRRDGENANSALLVNVNPEDFKGEGVLAGCELQKCVEQAAFNIANGKVPITTVGNFLNGDEPVLTEVKPTVKPEYVFADFSDIFPDFITESLKEGIRIFDRKIKGFADASAVLTAPETRSSSPVRILRNENFESVAVSGIYPCGEGAGYAGGIVSAAVDGIAVAEQLIE